MTTQNNPVKNYPGKFYSRLDDTDRQDLLSLGVKRSLPKDHRLFQAGKTSEDVYIVLTGRVKVSELSREGREVILWFCFAGELIGMSEMLSGGAHEYNALTCCPCEILYIKQNEFEEFIAKRPNAARLIVDVLSCRLQEVSDVLLNLTTENVSARVINLLWRLSVRYGTLLEDRIRIDIPLTHQEMADMIGTSRQSVTTVLGQLKRQGVIRVEQRTICVEDLAWIDSVIETPKRTTTSSDSTWRTHTTVLPFFTP